jgi:osmotically-inducible protein OsmY
MSPSGRRDKGVPGNDPFPPTETTLNEPSLRATLDDRRLAGRESGSTLNDQEIAGQAMIALSRNNKMDLGDGLNDKIRVSSEGGIVTITGVVGSAEERLVAEELIEQVPGVQMIQNALTVSVDSPLDDGELNRRVREKLDGSGFSRVGSRVSHGIARLTGTTERLADEEQAIRVAGSVKGVGDVVSTMKIPMPPYTDQPDLVSLVNQALELNDLVVMDRAVQVINGIAQISGVIKSLPERRRIREAIRQIAGIRQIKDQLKVDPALFGEFAARTHLSTGR